MSDKEQIKEGCIVDSNIWLYILLPGQDIEKSKTAKNLVRRRNEKIVISTQIINEVVNGILKHHRHARWFNS